MDGLVLAAVCALLVAGATVVVLQTRRARRQAAELAAARAETEQLAARLAELSARLERWQPPPREAAYVITDAGAAPLEVDDRPVARDSLVLSAAVGEPLVKALALGAGVRRALSAESRNRIRFAVRQETRRARKHRRREMRDAWLAHRRESGRRPDDEAARAA